jgi:AhpD family alkylhydroperoxidase
MDYNKISKETFDYIYKSRASLNNSPLATALRILTELRISQINGCAYCCQIHLQEALNLGIQQEKLDALIGWPLSNLFSKEEKTALQWAEAVTHLDKDLLQVKEQLSSVFSEKEIVDLTACISIMNALNRIAITLRTH